MEEDESKQENPEINDTTDHTSTSDGDQNAEIRTTVHDFTINGSRSMLDVQVEGSHKSPADFRAAVDADTAWGCIMKALDDLNLHYNMHEDRQVITFGMHIPQLMLHMFRIEDATNVNLHVFIRGVRPHTMCNVDQYPRCFNITCSMRFEGAKGVCFDELQLLTVPKHLLSKGYEFIGRVQAGLNVGTVYVEDWHDDNPGALVCFKQTVTLGKDDMDNKQTVGGVLERATDFLLEHAYYLRRLEDSTMEELVEMRSKHKAKRSCSEMFDKMSDGPLGQLGKLLKSGDPSDALKRIALLAALGSALGCGMDLDKLLKEMEERRKRDDESESEED